MAEVPAAFNQPGAAFVLLRDGEKFPPIEKEWQKNPHSYDEACQHKGNIGIMAGNGYMGLDQDDPVAFEGLTLPATTKWQTRPGRYGMWFKADDVAAALKAIGKKPDQAQLKLFKNGRPCGEVKLQRTYQVIPPSWKKLEDGSHSDYVLVDGRPPAIINLADLLATLQAGGISFSSKDSRLDQNAATLIAHGKEVQQKRVAAAVAEQKSGPEWLPTMEQAANRQATRERAYCEAALQKELDELSKKIEGERNDQLNKAAFNLGQLIAPGQLEEAEVISALRGVARQIGLEEGEIDGTIQSGITSGMNNPRDIPKPDNVIAAYEEIVDVKCDQAGNVRTARLMPTRAAEVILGRMPLAMEADSEDIYYFNGQIYLPDGARKIDIELCKVAKDLVTADKLKEVLRRIRNALKEKPVTFDPNPYLLGVKNGVTDLLTGKFREYRPEDLMTDQIPVEFDPAAKCPAFLAFLESITPNPSDRITLIDWFVAHAIKEPLPYVLFLLGLGRNGKGIYERLLKAFFGRAAFRDMPLSEISRNNFAASGFYRKRGWIASETGKKKATIGTDFMKLTSGNGVIDGDRKNQSRIQFEPYFQTTVDTNNMPQIEDNSVGWMERFIKADLPYFFVENPDKSNPLEKLRDPHIFEKLSTPADLSGILNLILYRSPEICRTKTIHKRPAAEMFTEYAEQSSSVKAFLDEFCEYDSSLFGLRTPSEPIYEAYREWCQYKVGEVVNKAYFGRQLKRFCGGIEPRRARNKKTQKYTTDYQGLIFDSSKFQTALNALRISIVQERAGKLQVDCKREEEEEDLQITKLQALQVNMWIDITNRFGGEREKKNLEEISSKEESVNLPATLAMPATTISGGAVSEDAICNVPVHSHALPAKEPTGPSTPSMVPVKKEFGSTVDDVDVAASASAQDEARAEHFAKKAEAVAANSVVKVRFKTDYKTDYSGAMHQFKEGDVAEIPAWRVESWLKRGVAEVVAA